MIITPEDIYIKARNRYEKAWSDYCAVYRDALKAGQVSYRHELWRARATFDLAAKELQAAGWRAIQ